MYNILLNHSLKINNHLHTIYFFYFRFLVTIHLNQNIFFNTIDGLRNKGEEAPQRTVVNPGTMVLLGIATSIDAFAVGIGMGLEHTMSDVLWAVGMIGGTTVIVSLVGVYLGRRNIPVPERTATILAGVVLIGLGVKILLEHLVLH